MPKRNTSKPNQSSNIWSSKVDDFSLWQEDENEKQENDQPLLQSKDKAHTGSHMSAKAAGKDAQRGSNVFKTPWKSTAAKEKALERSTATTNIVSSQLPSATVTPSSTTDVQSAPSSTTRSPWQYTERAPQPTVPAMVHTVPTAPGVNAVPAPKSAEELPKYTYRNPTPLRGPTQQTIRAPFAEVVNVDTRKTLGDPRPGNDHRQSYPQMHERNSSSSSASSRIFDTASSSSSRTLSSSSPYAREQIYSDKSASSSKKRPAASQLRGQTKRLAPARVTCREGITKQTILDFEPIQSATPRKRAPPVSLPSKVPGRNTLSTPPPALSSSSSRMSPPRHTRGQSPYHRDQSQYYQDDQHYTPRQLYQPKPYRSEMNAPSNSLRSARDEAIDREFYQSFRDSPARERIAADYQTSRDNGSGDYSRLRTQSEEERRLRQYPGVFDTDRDSGLRSSTKKLEQFKAGDWRSSPQNLADAMKVHLPSTPRLGAASRFKSRDVLARAARVQNEDRQHSQHQQTPRPLPSNNGRSYHQAISVASESSDEFECDFNFEGLREEDLARLEAS